MVSAKKKAKTPIKKPRKYKHVNKLGGGGKLNAKDRLTRRKLVFIYHECEYKQQIQIAKLLNITQKTVKSDLDYWKKNPQERPLEALGEPDTLRLVQICKTESRIRELRALVEEIKKPYCEVKVVKVTNAVINPTTVTKTSKRRDALVKGYMQDIAAEEKSLAILKGVWVEKAETEHKGETLDVILAKVAENMNKK